MVLSLAEVLCCMFISAVGLTLRGQPYFLYFQVFQWFSSLCPVLPILGFPGGAVAKTLPVNAGDAGSISGSGKFPAEGNGNPLQYSCLGNAMDKGAWHAGVHGVTKSRTRLSDETTTAILSSFLFSSKQPPFSLHPLATSYESTSACVTIQSSPPDTDREDTYE